MKLQSRALLCISWLSHFVLTTSAFSAHWPLCCNTCHVNVNVDAHAHAHTHFPLRAETEDDGELSSTSGGRKDNNAMAFLRKIGKVGGTTSNELLHGTGSDEGPADKTSGGGMKNMRKSRNTYQECTESGVIDDMTEIFPFTSSGTEWAGFTDRLMGGVSSGSLAREIIEGRTANVLSGKVSLANNGGFVQMATDLCLDPTVGSVDASEYDGIELDVLFQEGDECIYPSTDEEEPDCDMKESFNVHLKSIDCQRQFTSYRATFEITQGSWETIRLPWSAFNGHGPGIEDTALDVSGLRRVGIVAMGKEMNVFIALAGARLYNVILKNATREGN